MTTACVACFCLRDKNKTAHRAVLFLVLFNDYLIKPAFFYVAYAPFLLIVLMASVEIFSMKNFLSSGT